MTEPIALRPVNGYSHVMTTKTEHRVEFDLVLAKCPLGRSAPWKRPVTKAALRQAMLDFNADLEPPDGPLANITCVIGAPPYVHTARIVRNRDNRVVVTVTVQPPERPAPTIGRPGRWKPIE